MILVIEQEVTSDVALMVVLLQQAAVVDQLFVFVRLSLEVSPGGGAAAVLGQRPGPHKREGSQRWSTHKEHVVLQGDGLKKER